MTKTEILDAINLLLVSKWPDRTVYVDVCPVDFNRPSFWLTVEKYDLTDGNRFLIRHDLQIRLTLYDELDEHYDASWYRLSQDTDAVTELLIRGWMVGHRHLKPLLKVLPRDPDRAYVQINLSWMDNRPGLDTGSIHPRRRRLFRHGSGETSTERSDTMGLPELTFSLKKAADNVATRVSSGIVAMILRDAKANGLHTINRESDIPSELGAANIAAIKRAMLGYITKPTTLYVSVIGADADIKTGFQALAVHSYDYLVGPVDIASADATALAAQVKAQRTKALCGQGDPS